MRQDLLYGFRNLRRSPTFAAAAVLTLALGIGANSALFSVIDSVLIRPLPYPDPHKLVMLYGRLANGETEEPSPADFLDYRRQSQSFENLAGFRELPFNLTGLDRPERIQGAVVTPEFFAVLKVNPQIGRVFLAQVDRPGSRLIVLSDSLWREKYAGDPHILGKSIQVDGEPRTVIGIMPPAFQFPLESQVWTLSRFAVIEQPLSPNVDQSNSRDSHYFDAIGRLKAGVTLSQALAETDVIARRLKRQFGNDEEAVGSAVVDLHQDLVGQTRPGLLMLLGGVALLLLIACANVANLLLARGSSRQKEIGVRAALGAGRSRIIRQLMAESLLLAAVGGAAGVWVASPISH